MPSTLHQQAILLHQSGKTLREVAEALGRSHEWVRTTMLENGVELRVRGAEQRKRPACLRCGKACQTLRARYCSRVCLSAARKDTAMAKLNIALDVLKQGAAYSEAARAAGFSSAWHLWGRLHHFGLVPKDENSVQDEPTPKSVNDVLAAEESKESKNIPTTDWTASFEARMNQAIMDDAQEMKQAPVIASPEGGVEWAIFDPAFDPPDMDPGGIDLTTLEVVKIPGVDD